MAVINYSPEIRGTLIKVRDYLNMFSREEPFIDFITPAVRDEESMWPTPDVDPLTPEEEIFLETESMLYDKWIELCDSDDPKRELFNEVNRILDSHPVDMVIDGVEYLYLSNLEKYNLDLVNDDLLIWHTKSYKITPVSNTKPAIFKDYNFGDRVLNNKHNEVGIVVSCPFVDKNEWYCYIVYQSRGTSGIKTKLEHFRKA